MTALRCPSNPSKYHFLGTQGGNDKYWTNHIYNKDLGNTGTATSSATYHKLAEVKDPCRTIEFADGVNNGSIFGSASDYDYQKNSEGKTPEEIWLGWFAFIHNGGVNIMFLDGHCGWHKLGDLKRSWLSLEKD